MIVSYYTEKASRWIAESSEILILHQFEQVLYLKNQVGAVVAIHDEEIDRLPFSIEVIDFEAVKGELQTEGVSAFIKGLTIADGKRWDPTLAWKLIRQADLPQLASHLDADLERRLNTLIAAVRSNRMDGIIRAAAGLAGRGIGLTPTGDDLLVGCLYGLHALGWEQAIIQAIGAAAYQRTTTLSAAFLKAAVAGEATLGWHRFLQQEPGALEQLLDIGHTSGRDAMWGVASTIGELGNG